MSPQDEAVAAVRVARFAAACRDDETAQEAASRARLVTRNAARDAAKHGAPIAELARIAGVSRHTIYDWLRPAASQRGERRT